MKINRILIFSLLILVCSPAFAQNRILHGRVFTFDSIPLIYASVAVKSTKQVAKTDTLGFFTVSCGKTDQIKISAKGFNTEKIKIAENIQLAMVNLKLKPGEKNREYAIGYGYVRDADKLIAVVNVNDEDVNFSQYTDMYELLKGRFAGVQVYGDQITIRGTRSFNASNEALIILDGSEIDKSILKTLPPTNVKSIDVIKDGGAAIYGARGANGVIIIETKRGRDL